MIDAFEDRPKTISDYLAVLRRRKWIVLLPLVLAGVSAYLISSNQEARYRATSDVLVDRSSLVTAITGVFDPSSGDPDRFLATQASIARSPELAERVAAKIPGATPGDVLSQTSVNPSNDSDLLFVSARADQPEQAVRLANTFASEFTDFTKERATQSINNALVSIRAGLASLRARGQTDSPQYSDLLEQQGRLQTVGKLLAGNTSVLQPARGAQQTQPRPRHDAILAGLFGLVLGLALAFLAEALDRHVRSEQEVGEALKQPLLGRVSKPSRSLRKANDLVMLKEPATIQAETFRKLRTSLEFVNPAKTIMVTSAGAQEGKSTTISNLAVALARANPRVVLVDLDLRAPFVSRLFHINGRPGITDVAVGRASLDQALHAIALPSAYAEPGGQRRNGTREPVASPNGGAPVDGVLHVLPAGTIPPSADEMLQDPHLLAVLDELASKFDRVLIDAPPLLAFGDAMVLSAKVDAMFAVAHLGKVQRPLLHEFARQLGACRADLIGYVITGAEHSDSSRYMYEGYAYDVAVRERSSSKERV